MATTPPSESKRNENLDALKKAMDEFFEDEKRRLDNETKFMRAVLEGRGASDAGTRNLATQSALLQVEVDEFIAGG
jgi:hypothetical protein